MPDNKIDKKIKDAVFTASFFVLVNRCVFISRRVWRFPIFRDIRRTFLFAEGNY